MRTCKQPKRTEAHALPADVDLERALEAILMVADEPQSLVALATALGAPGAAVRPRSSDSSPTSTATDGGSPARLRAARGRRRLAHLRARRVRRRSSRDFVLTQNPTKLSQAALETLAVIAYKQPISRGAIASIRAVNVDSVVRTLLGRGLITEAFTDSETGAIHYETTDLLLTPARHQLDRRAAARSRRCSPTARKGSMTTIR